MTDPLPTVTDEASAIAFLTALHERGWLYHPEDRADDCLGHLNLGTERLAEIQAGVDACFEKLGDPCIFALDIMEGGEETRAYLAGGGKLPTLPSERGLNRLPSTFEAIMLVKALESLVSSGLDDPAITTAELKDDPILRRFVCAIDALSNRIERDALEWAKTQA